jgi:hypothetical protein
MKESKAKIKRPGCTCKLKDSEGGKTVNPNHQQDCCLFISKCTLYMLRRSTEALEKYRDPRDRRLHNLAGRRLKLVRDGKNWVISYTGRGTTSGLIPDFIPLPHVSLVKEGPERIYAQIRGALVTFALEVLNDSRFRRRSR